MTTAPLFLIDDLPGGLSEDIAGDLSGADSVLLAGEEGHHAARVRRVRVGEQVTVCDGRGAVADCTVRAVNADEVVLHIDARRHVPAADPRLVVVQAIPKGERAELAVELMTELGVDEIVPWHSARSLVRWDGARADRALARWRRTAREAAKQSRRAWVPNITDPASTAAVLQRLTRATIFVLHEAATEPLATAALPRAGTVAVVVGPEGGIADEELTALAAAGARAVRLGEPVLRTSTAGAAALAALSVRLGRWG